MFPIGQLLAQHSALQPLALPENKIGKLHHRLRQWRRFLRGEGLIERQHLPQYDNKRPAIVDKMMFAMHQNMLLLVETQQRPANQRQSIQCVGDQSGLPDAFLCLCSSLGQRYRAQIHDRQFNGKGRMNDLPGLANLFTKSGAENFMPPDDFRQSPLQRSDIKRSGKAQC